MTQPTMIPILAPSLNPWCAAAALWVGEAAGGGVGDVEGELVDEEDVVSLATADFTTLAAAPAAPMKLFKGFEVVAAACAATLATLDRTMAAERRICRCIVAMTMKASGIAPRALLDRYRSIRCTNSKVDMATTRNCKIVTGTRSDNVSVLDKWAKRMIVVGKGGTQDTRDRKRAAQPQLLYDAWARASREPLL